MGLRGRMVKMTARSVRRVFPPSGRTSHRAWLLALPALAVAFAAAAEPVPDTCRIHYPDDAAIAWTCHRIGRHDTLTRLFGAHWRGALRFNRIDRRHIYPGVRIKVPDDLSQVHDFTPMPRRYPPAAGFSKFILVNLTEQFLGAYDNGKLVLSFPVASGKSTDPTPDGLFRVTAYDRLHSSSVYDIEGTHTPYPMHYALRFYITPQGVADWIHGRDLPGYPASHGCIGLYDEQMQKEYYGNPRHPILESARELFEWAIAPHPDNGRFHDLADGPPVLIIGKAPDFPPRPAKAAATSQRSDCSPRIGLALTSCGK